jgi:hypothetical protein
VREKQKSLERDWDAALASSRANGPIALHIVVTASSNALLCDGALPLTGREVERPSNAIQHFDAVDAVREHMFYRFTLAEVFR